MNEALPGNGQSGGDSRIFRHTHDDPRLIAFARRSLERWREWERQTGQELVSRDGVVFLGSTARERHAALTAAGVSARLVDGAEVAAVLPLLVAQDDSHELLLDEDGGVIRTRTAIEMLRAAVADRIVYDEVMSVRPTPGGTVEVRRGDATAEHDQVLVCAGIGTAGLAHGSRDRAATAVLVARAAGVRAAGARRRRGSRVCSMPAAPPGRPMLTAIRCRATAPTRSASPRPRSIPTAG